MIIKRYLVGNMNEAMTRIRYELGKDAVIISQRKVRKPGFSGLFSKKIIEVTAAVENIKKNDEEVANSIEAIKKAISSNENAVSNINKVISNETKVNTEIGAANNKVLNENTAQALNQDVNSDLIKELQEMKLMINGMVNKTSEKATRKTKLQTALENNDLNEKVVKKIITKVKSNEDNIEEIEKVRIAIEKLVSVSKNTNDRVMVLVGPTGVGKTTTIAKLAGKLALLDKKKVGLITIDTYRIGAVEQLKTYADIMNIPFKVVLTLKEMDAAVESMKDCDAILIDTTGRSSKNTMQISELRAFTEKANTDNIHLVLSCTTKNKDIQSIIEGYKVLKYNNIIITKLDETTTYGSIVNILDMGKKPLSYVTTGQNVPDDLKKLTPNEISKLILGEDSVC